MKKLLFIPVAIVIVTLLVVFFIIYSGKPKNGKGTQSVSPTPIIEVINQLKEKETLVEVTSTGFAPETVTIPMNSSVRWVNMTKNPVSVNSDDHPTHRKNIELNLGSFDASGSVILLLTKPGTYTYHNHYNPTQKGKIIVQ